MTLLHFERWSSRVARAALSLACFSVALNSLGAQRVDNAEHRSFTIRDFRTESGVVIPTATIVYGTYGHLNAARDNAILLPSHYMANHHGYEWLIGPGKALDTSRVFLVATELFGNGKSSSPSNTPEPLHGPRFPVTTIRDNVAAVHELLAADLGISHLRAIIGFSMGAQQAFQWAVSYPGFADRIVATSGTAKTWPHGVVRLEGQIAALTADAAFNGGDYTSPPAKGLSAFGMVWAGWLYSQEWWRRELWRTNSAPGATFETVVERFRSNFIPGGDANDLILQARTWQQHDVSTTPGMNGDIAKALASIRDPFLYMPSETDMYFPINDATYEASLMKTVTFAPIKSLWGHTAGAASNPADAAFLNTTIAKFLGGASASAQTIKPALPASGAKRPPGAREGFVTASDGARLFYRVIGKGNDTLVAIHGGPGVDLESIAGDFAPLGLKHVVIFYDQRGAGRSTLPADTTTLNATQQIADLEAVRVHFGINKLTLIAHSYGPLLAATYAIAHPDHMRRMIFLGPVPPRRGDFWKRFADNANARMDSTVRQKSASANRRLMTATTDSDIVSACRDYWAAAMIPRLAEPSRSLPLIRSDLCASDAQGIRFGLTTTNRLVMNSYGDWDIRPQLRTLQVPTLIIHGENEAIPMDLVEEWVSSLPHATLIKVPRAAHFAYAERADVVWPSVEAFLAKR